MEYKKKGTQNARCERSNASNIFLALTKRERTYQREKNVEYTITDDLVEYYLAIKSRKIRRGYTSVIKSF